MHYVKNLFDISTLIGYNISKYNQIGYKKWFFMVYIIRELRDATGMTQKGFANMIRKKILFGLVKGEGMMNYRRITVFI